MDPEPFEPRRQLRTLRNLLPYLWPQGRGELRLRVCLAIVALIGAKVANVYVPILLSHTVDALGVQANLLLAIPLALLLAYGAARVGAIALGEVRDALCTKDRVGEGKSIGVVMTSRLDSSVTGQRTFVATFLQANATDCVEHVAG